jgi:ATP-binding cassette subfamily C (CFTR/MRP) protein 1
VFDPRNILDANTAFVSLTLFNLLRVPLNVLPILIVYLIQCQVSLNRINKFINSEEIDPNTVDHDPKAEAVVHIKGAAFAWSKSTSEAVAAAPTLNRINLEVKPGQLVAIGN